MSHNFRPDDPPKSKLKCMEHEVIVALTGCDVLVSEEKIGGRLDGEGAATASPSGRVVLGGLAETESRRGTEITVNVQAGEHQDRHTLAWVSGGWGSTAPIVAGPLSRDLIRFAKSASFPPLMTIGPPGETHWCKAFEGACVGAGLGPNFPNCTHREAARPVSPINNPRPVSYPIPCKGHCRSAR